MVVERRGVQRERTLAQHRQVENRDQKWHSRQPALADDLATPADLLEGDLNFRTGLMLAAQHQEGVVGEAGLVHAQVLHPRGGRQPLDKANADIRLALQRSLDRAELPRHRRDLVRRGVDQPDAGQAVQVEINRLPLVPIRRSHIGPHLMNPLIRQRFAAPGGNAATPGTSGRH